LTHGAATNKLSGPICCRLVLKMKCGDVAVSSARLHGQRHERARAPDAMP
jgi:hypothetical protein